MSRKRPLTRNQLAEFLPNHEAIKAFERIMDEVYDLLPTDVIAINQAINDLALSLGSTDAKAEIESGNSRQFDYIDFPQIAPVAPAARRLYYDDGDGTLMLTLKGGNSTLPIGQSEFELCFNGSVTTMARGTVVQITGAQGNRIKIDRARADAEATSNHTFGFVDESIASGAEGFVLNSGLIRKLNTITDSEGNALTQGDTLYLSTSVSGGYTRVKPVAPNHLVIVGFVVRVHASVGEIFVKVDNGYEIDELHNVYAPSPANGNTLIYNSTTSRWEASSSFDTVNIATINSATTLRLQTGGVDRVTVDAAGNAGLGVVPPIIAGNRRALLIGNTTVASVYHYAGIGESAYNWHLDGGSVSRYATTNPAGTFEFNNSAVGGFAWKIAPSGTAGAPITFSQAMTLTQGGNLLVGGTTDTGTRARFESTNKQLGLTYTGIATYNLTTDVSGNLTIDKDGAERARITSGGYFKASNTGSYVNASGEFHEFNGQGSGETVFINNQVSASTALLLHTRGAANFAGTHILAENTGTTVFRVLANGNVQNTNNSYGAISDIKLKENITDATPKLDSLNKLRVVNYNLIGSDLKQIGLIAQEVEAIFPGLVESTPDTVEVTKTRTVEVPAVLDEEGNEVTPATTTEETYTEREPNGEVTKAVKYSVLVPMLLKGMQEQQAMIQALTDRIAALEAKSS
jgi:hypothetical protein